MKARRTDNLRQVKGVVADGIEDEVLQLVHHAQQVLPERRHDPQKYPKKMAARGALRRGCVEARVSLVRRSRCRAGDCAHGQMSTRGGGDVDIVEPLLPRLASFSVVIDAIGVIGRYFPGLRSSGKSGPSPSK